MIVMLVVDENKPQRKIRLREVLTPVGTTDKVAIRADAVEDLDYTFRFKHLPNGRMFMRCIRLGDEHLISVGLCHNNELEAAVETLVNDAYNILYGEENDEEIDGRPLLVQ